MNFVGTWYESCECGNYLRETLWNITYLNETDQKIAKNYNTYHKQNLIWRNITWWKGTKYNVQERWARTFLNSSYSINREARASICLSSLLSSLHDTTANSTTQKWEEFMIECVEWCQCLLSCTISILAKVEVVGISLGRNELRRV